MLDASTTADSETHRVETLARPPKFPAWTTREVELMKSTYCTFNGVARCMQAMPYRSRGSIYAKARDLGIEALNRGTLGKRFSRIHHPSDYIDQVIRETYAAAGLKRGAVARMAELIGRPPWWVQRRAAELGVSKAADISIRPWVEAEVEILEEMAGARPITISRALRKAGFDRTEIAVTVKLKRLNLDRHDPDTWLLADLARMCGMSDSPVRRWISDYGLAFTQPGGPRGHIYITRQAFVRWLHKGNAARLDLRKVDQPWFIDIAFGRKP